MPLCAASRLSDTEQSYCRVLPWLGRPCCLPGPFDTPALTGPACAGPAALVGSNLPVFGLQWRIDASHWPFQLGYFASSMRAHQPVGNDSAARRTAPIKFLRGMACSLLIALVHHEPLTSCESTPPSRVYEEAAGPRGMSLPEPEAGPCRSCVSPRLQEAPPIELDVGIHDDRRSTSNFARH